MIEQYERMVANGHTDSNFSSLPYGKVKTSSILKRLESKHPYQRRHLPNICTNFYEGLCKRGDDCPYRHEMPLNPTMSEQELRERCSKDDSCNLVPRSSEPPPPPPADLTITTVFVGGIFDEVSEDTLK